MEHYRFKTKNQFVSFKLNFLRTSSSVIGETSNGEILPQDVNAFQFEILNFCLNDRISYKLGKSLGGETNDLKTMDPFNEKPVEFFIDNKVIVCFNPKTKHYLTIRKFFETEQ